MKTELITIGDEILIGQTINTNAAWLGEQLALIGIKVNRSITISDTKQDILDALAEGNKADLVIITGGLGPTKDDITKPTLCEYFDTELELHEDILIDIKNFFIERNKPFLEINNLQAMLPKKCEVIRNYVGTASGMWFEKDGTVFISIPGVPYEMEHLMETSLLSKIGKKFNIKALYHATVLTQGIGESYLAEKLTEWENDLWMSNLNLAYLPSPGIVKLRVSSLNGDKIKVDRKIKELYDIIPTYIYGTGNQTLAEVVGDLLKEKGKTVSLAESCTGGYASHLLTLTPGSSAYFMGSVICYAYEIKETELNVPNSLLETKGAVSQEVVDILSTEIRKKYNTDYSIAISGIAGPDGGTEDKPVGTVWIAVSNKEKIISKKFTFGNNRGRNIEQSALAGLNMLRLLLKE